MIFRDEIRLSVYNLSEYPTVEDTENGSSVIPKSLKLFLYRLLNPEGKKICCSHSAIYCNSTFCDCHLQTTVFHFTTATCHISIFTSQVCFPWDDRLLSSISFADDYKEVQRLENGMISAGEPSYSLKGFTQFLFDNALTGHSTFHAMGGIACVTQPGQVEKCPVKRIMQPPPAGQITIKTYNKPPMPAHKSVHIEPPRTIDNNRLRLSAFYLAWMLGYLLILTPCLRCLGVALWKLSWKMMSFKAQEFRIYLS